MRTSEMQGNSTKNAENYRTVCKIVESLANIMYRKEYAFEYVVQKTNSLNIPKNKVLNIHQTSIPQEPINGSRNI